MWKFIWLLPAALLAQSLSEKESLLSQAEGIAKKYSLEVAKVPPPVLSPQGEKCLEKASVWFTLDLGEIASPAFQTLNQDLLWDHLTQIGVEGVYLQGMKGEAGRKGLALDPRWGSDWDALAGTIGKRGTVLIGDSLGTSTGLIADFWLALKNVGEYPSLYHLIEIEKGDWKFLPDVAGRQYVVNVPWLSLQQLQKKGYVPEQFTPYVKRSNWNATGPIQCVDGMTRRWIYLMQKENEPVLDWLNGSFAASRIAAADTLDSVFHLGQKIFFLDGAIGRSAKETLALWMRKLGGYSVVEPEGGLDSYKESGADLIADRLTRPALLHAMIAEDTEALKLIYRLFLEEGVENQRLVHMLQPLDAFGPDWKEWLEPPQKKFHYYEEVLTGEALRMRLIKEDVDRIGEKRETTYPSLCMAALGVSDVEKVMNAHLLLSLFYAMQPGAFSFSASDLLGTLQRQPIDLMGPNEGTLYPSLPGQLRNPKSFAMQLKKLLAARRESQVARGELVAVPMTQNRGVILLLHRLPESGMLHLLAVNFSRTGAREVVEMGAIRNTTAIDLISGLAEKKGIDSATLRLELPPMSGKAILFQTKYYD